jgi:sugar phosphate isomerase/epimerase
MVELGRPLGEIAEYEPYIKHVHLDNPLSEFPKRVVPRRDDGFDYGPFLEALKGISYKGIISVEASAFEDYAAEIKGCIDFFASQGIQPYRA